MVTRRAAVASIALGVSALAVDIGAFRRVEVDRATEVDVTGDSYAYLGLSGFHAGEPASYTNRFTGQAVVTLDSMEPSLELDVGVTGSYEDTPVSFTLDEGETMEVELRADVDDVDVLVQASYPDAYIELSRSYEVPEATGVELVADVRAVGGSGRYEWGLENTGGRAATVTSVGVSCTSNSEADRVDSNRILNLEGESIADNPMEIESGCGYVDRVNVDSFTVEPLNDGGRERVLEFDRFMRPPGSPGPPHADMRGEDVTVNIGFQDGSRRSFELEDD